MASLPARETVLEPAPRHASGNANKPQHHLGNNCCSSSKPGKRSRAGTDGRAGEVDAPATVDGVTRVPLEGKNDLFCDGEVVMGPEKRLYRVALGLTVVGMAVYFATTSVYMWRNVSPAVPIVAGYLAALTFITFFRTAMSDPGILPREPPPEHDDPYAPSTVDSIVRGAEIKRKWCNTCHFYRPPRTVHCFECDNCVECYDHHCPWTSNCIGRRNYRYYFSYLGSLTAFILYAIGSCVAHVVLVAREDGASEIGAKAVPRYPPTRSFSCDKLDFGGGIYVCVAAIALWPVGGLFVFHCSLISIGKTTNERLTNRLRGVKNPYDRGAWSNLLNTICGVRYPRYVLRHEQSPPAASRDAVEMVPIPRTASTLTAVPMEEHRDKSRRFSLLSIVNGARRNTSRGHTASAARHNSGLTAGDSAGAADADNTQREGGRPLSTLSYASGGSSAPYPLASVSGGAIGRSSFSGRAALSPSGSVSGVAAEVSGAGASGASGASGVSRASGAVQTSAGSVGDVSHSESVSHLKGDVTIDVWGVTCEVRQGESDSDSEGGNGVRGVRGAHIYPHPKPAVRDIVAAIADEVSTTV